MLNDGFGYNDDEQHHMNSTWHTAPLEGILLDERWASVVYKYDKPMG
jgi:hypothetical protein